ncbi:MAG: transglutaminase domain-containing protein [Pseudomonadota bacterium]
MENDKIISHQHASNKQASPIVAWRHLAAALALWLLLAYAGGVAASDGERLVALKATITVNNKGDMPISNYIHRVTIPADDPPRQQLLRIDYPYGDSHTMAKHVNGVDRFMEFYWGIPPHSRLIREITFHLRLKPYDYQKDMSPKIAKPGHFFLDPSLYVESNSPEVRRIAEPIRRSYADKESQLRAAYMYPQLNLNYQNMENKGALYAIREGKGDCTEYAALFVAISRSLGIPARLTSEFLFSKRNEFSWPNHHATEVYLDGRWIPVDPNLALEPSLGYGFGISATSKVTLKRDGSWTWSNQVPGVSRQYRENLMEVGMHWDIKEEN